MYSDSILFVRVHHPVMLYMSIELAWCSIDPGISRDSCKIACTPWVIKKNLIKKYLE
jgi:hypothetical protein